MDFCETLELEYPYAHAIGNIRAIIGADWIKPTEKVKRVQAVLNELDQRVLERCVGGTDTNVRSKLTSQEVVDVDLCSGRSGQMRTKPLTNEAVEITMKRLEALKDGKGD